MSAVKPTFNFSEASKPVSYIFDVSLHKAIATGKKMMGESHFNASMAKVLASAVTGKVSEQGLRDISAGTGTPLERTEAFAQATLDFPIDGAIQTAGEDGQAAFECIIDNASDDAKVSLLLGLYHGQKDAVNKALEMYRLKNKNL